MCSREAEGMALMKRWSLYRGGLIMGHPFPFISCIQEMTLQHIIADPDILMNELDAYSNLPDDLKDEIRKLLSSINPHLALRHSNLTETEEAPVPVGWVGWNVNPHSALRHSNLTGLKPVQVGWDGA